MPILSPEQAARIKLESEKEKLWAIITPRLLPDGLPDPAPFLAFLGLVKTKDEKDEGKVKPFPLHLDYISDLAQHFTQQKLLLVPKSRQMIVSWLAVSYCVWKCHTLPNQLVLWISKNLEDACEMVFNKDDPSVARASFICWNLPTWAFSRPVGKYGSLVYPNGSQMQAIQQNPEAVRQKAASLIVSDEMAFQDRAADTFTAARPSISGGGQFIGISSAHPGFFWSCVEDNISTE